MCLYITLIVINYKRNFNIILKFITDWNLDLSLNMLHDPETKRGSKDGITLTHLRLRNPEFIYYNVKDLCDKLYYMYTIAVI